MGDPYIKYRYLSDGRTVEIQCSAAHRQISTGAAEPLDEWRETYIAWCAAKGHAVPQHVPTPVAEVRGQPAAVASVVGPGSSARAEKAKEPEPEPELIPADFPHAKELARVGIVTFDAVPADLMATKVPGIGRAGARKVAEAMAARAEG